MRFLLLTLFVFAGCAAGPRVTVCIVDSKNLQFVCTNEKKTSLIPFESQSHLLCASPHDLEKVLKACKGGSILKVTECKLDFQQNRFVCYDPVGNDFFLLYPDVDNYVCLSQQDKDRLLERCHS